MELTEIYNLVDTHPESQVQPGSYRTLKTGRVYLIVEAGGSRQVRVEDTFTGQTVFVGNDKGISLLVDGDWQDDVKTAIAENKVEPKRELSEEELLRQQEAPLLATVVSEIPGPGPNTPTEIVAAPPIVAEEDVFAKPIEEDKKRVTDDGTSTVAEEAPIAETTLVSSENVEVKEAVKDEPVVQTTRRISFGR